MEDFFYFVNFYHLFIESFVFFACFTVAFLLILRGKYFCTKVFGFGFALYGLSTFFHLLFYPSLPYLVYALRVAAGLVFWECTLYKFYKKHLHGMIPLLPSLPLTHKIFSIFIFLGAVIWAFWGFLQNKNRRTKLLFFGFFLVFFSELCFFITTGLAGEVAWTLHHLFKFFGFDLLLIWAFEYVSLTLGARLYINFLTLMFAILFVSSTISSFIVQKILISETKNNLFNTAEIVKKYLEENKKEVKKSAYALSYFLNQNLKLPESEILAKTKTCGMDFLFLFDSEGKVLKQLYTQNNINVSPEDFKDILKEDNGVLKTSKTIVNFAISPFESNQYLVCGKDWGEESFWQELKQYTPDFDFNLFISNNLFASTNSNQKNKSLEDPNLLKEVLIFGNKYFTFDSTSETPHYEIFFPLEDKFNQKIALVSVSAPAQSIKDIAQTGNKLILGIFTALLVFSSLLYLKTKKEII